MKFESKYCNFNLTNRILKLPSAKCEPVHDLACRPLAQFDLISSWTTWKLLWVTYDYNEMLKHPILWANWSWLPVSFTGEQSCPWLNEVIKKKKKKKTWMKQLNEKKNSSLISVAVSNVHYRQLIILETHSPDICLVASFTGHMTLLCVSNGVASLSD